MAAFAAGTPPLSGGGGHSATVLRLTQARVERLTAVFRRFDLNGDGTLNAQEMRVFGWAVSGCRHVPSPEEVATQMARVAPHGSSVSLDAFLLYSTRLARLSDEAFGSLMALLDAGMETASRLGFVLPEGTGHGGASTALGVSGGTGSRAP
jgi:hypothetical protein